MSIQDEVRTYYDPKQKILDNSREQIERIDAVLKIPYSGKDSWKIELFKDIKSNLQDIVEYLE